MASRKERQRVLSGTMALSSPADKISDADARLLENWRVDLDNQLQSRNGSVKSIGPIGSGTFHTLGRYGANTVLGIGPNIYAKEGTVLSDTGYDGTQLGVVTYLGNTYVMNRKKQTRLLAGNVGAVPWCPLPPATAPFGAAAAPSNTASITQELEMFDGTSTNHVIAGGVDNSSHLPDFTSQTDRSNFIAGTGSLQLALTGIGSGSIQVDYLSPVNTEQISVGSPDADIFELSFFASDPTQIESITITLWANRQNWTVTQCFFEPGGPWDVSKVLNQTPNSWSKLQIRRTVNVDLLQNQISSLATGGQSSAATDLSGKLDLLLSRPAFQVINSQNPQIIAVNNIPINANNSNNFDWTHLEFFTISVTNRGPVTINVNDFKVRTSPSVAQVTGSVTYYVSFVDDAGHDSLPSPASNTVQIYSGSAPQLNFVPTSPASNIKARRIYRIGGGLTQPYLVGTINDNSSTGPWFDTTSNDQAQADNIIMPTNRTPPPPARFVVDKPFFGKIVAFNTDAHPNRIFWTPAGIPWAFPGQDDPDIGNWEDCGGDDDQILAATNHKTMLVFYKRSSIWRLSGDPDKADPIQTNANIGIAGPAAVVNGGTGDYVGWDEGIYFFNLDYETKISQALDPIFKGDSVILDNGQYLPPVEKSALATMCLGLSGDRLRVAYPEKGQILPNVVLIYHIPSGRWQREKYTNLAAPNFTALNYWSFGPLAPIMAAGATLPGAGGGYLYRLEVGSTDDGQPIPVNWQSRFFDQNLPDNLKWYSDVEIEFQTAVQGQTPSTLTVSLVFDWGATVVTLGTISAGTRTVLSLRLPKNVAVNIPGGGTDQGYLARNVAIRVTGNCTSTAIIYGAYIHWYPEERQAHTFDSGPLQLGAPERVKQADYLELYMTGSGQQLERTFSSDLPAGILTIRDQANFAAPNGRGTVRFRLPAIIEGRNMRFTIDDSPSGAPFQLHQARIRQRPIGEYIDGSIGEYYESPEFSVEPGRVGELKDFMLEYDVSGSGGRVEIYSDLPGSSMTLRRTLSLPFQSARAPYVFPLESGADTTSDYLPAGQLFKVRIYPPPGGILRLHGRAQFRGRILGVYFNGANGEVFETQPLDLLGGVGLFRELSIISQTAGPMTLEMWTELPNQDMQIAASFTVNTPATTQGRVPVHFRLPGTTKGYLQKFRLRGPYIARLFEIKVLGRRVQTNAGGWDWIPVPVPATPEGFVDIEMPVRQTPSAFEWVDLAVDAIE